MCVIWPNYLYDRDDDKGCENEYRGKGRFDRLNSVTSFRYGWRPTQTQAVSGMKKITSRSTFFNIAEGNIKSSPLVLTLMPLLVAICFQ